jgi:hypothetical protein
MSSQGPATGTATPSGASGCFGNTQNSQVPRGYTFSPLSIRDSSDWIAYKKQQLISKETTAGLNQTTWFKSGNDFRIQYLLGKFKCDSCKVSSGSVPSS